MTRKVCSDLKIKTGSLAVTNFKISKLIFDDQKCMTLLFPGTAEQEQKPERIICQRWTAQKSASLKKARLPV